ncbi:MAG: SGNH/GDSL hydrolase family protein [Planctomycetota bacterium]
MSETQRKKVWLKRARWLILVAVVFVVGAELVARLYLGLGDPPLSVADPEIEYLFKPSQDVRRFGNRVAFNAYSMRSDAFSRAKEDPSEFRLLVLGDSVINGGGQTDQSDLATQLLQDDLSDQLDRPVVVGNISAGSWGPANLLAYVKREGAFDADMIVLVISSHDAGDVPTFTPTVGVHPSFPDRKPILALQEAVTRYLPRYLPFLRKGGGEHNTQPTGATADDGAIPALTELIQWVQAEDVPMVIVHHAEQAELTSAYQAGYSEIAEVADALGAELIEAGPTFQEAIEAGEAPYRDNIHPNAAGQRLLAEVIQQAVLQDLQAHEDAATANAPDTPSE